MGQQEIANVLRSNFPNYLTYQEIMIYTKTSKSSVLRCLRQMKKRNEIQIKTILGKKLRSGWVDLYRIKD